MSGKEPKAPLPSRRFWQPYIVIDPESPCPKCGYSLAGLPNTTAMCPECGRELTRDDRIAEYRFRPAWESVWEVCVLPGIAASIMLLMGFVAFAIESHAAVIVMLIAGSCWLLTGGIHGVYLVAEAARVGGLRRGRQRIEHLIRLGFAATGLVLVMIVPMLGVACILWIARVL